MIKKIFNWVGGSFFRTLGRIFAFFVVSLLFIFILSKTDLKMPKFADLLGIARVNASETWIGNVKYGINSYYIYDLSSNSYTSKDYERGSVNRYSNTDKIYWYQNSGAMTIGNNGIMSAYNISQRTLSGYLYQLTFYACSNKRMYYLNITPEIFVGGKATDVANRPANSVTYQATNITELLATDANYCAMYTTLFVPKTTSNGSWVGLRLSATGNNITGLYFTAFGYDIQQLGLYDKTIEDIIKSSIGTSGVATSDQLQQATDEIKEETKKIDDTINNDNVDDSVSSGSSFFDNFTTDDNGGLSSVITAPLTAINSLLSGSCTPLQLPIKIQSKSTFITLPCGDYFFGRSELSSFMSFISMFLGGLICYGIAKDLFLTVEKLKNPEDDRVEVLDL